MTAPEWRLTRPCHALRGRLRPDQTFSPLLDGQEHLALHHPRAWLDDRVSELVLQRQRGGVEAVAADQPGALPAPTITRPAPTPLTCTLELRLDRSWRSQRNLRFASHMTITGPGGTFGPATSHGPGQD